MMYKYLQDRVSPPSLWVFLRRRKKERKSKKVPRGLLKEELKLQLRGHKLPPVGDWKFNKQKKHYRVRCSRCGRVAIVKRSGGVKGEAYRNYCDRY